MADIIPDDDDQEDLELAELLEQYAVLSAEVDETQSKIARLQVRLWRERRQIQARRLDPGLSDQERERLQRLLDASQLNRLLANEPDDTKQQPGQ